MEINNLGDGREALHRDLVEMKRQLDHLKSLYLKIYVRYAEKKNRYEVLDRAWAERDGRLKKYKVAPKPKIQKQMSQEEILKLIADLEQMVK